MHIFAQLAIPTTESTCWRVVDELLMNCLRSSGVVDLKKHINFKILLLIWWCRWYGILHGRPMGSAETVPREVEDKTCRTDTFSVTPPVGLQQGATRGQATAFTPPLADAGAGSGTACWRAEPDRE
jgi:hypothetical protein